MGKFRKPGDPTAAGVRCPSFREAGDAVLRKRMHVIEVESDALPVVTDKPVCAKRAEAALSRSSRRKMKAFNLRRREIPRPSERTQHAEVSRAADNGSRNQVSGCALRVEPHYPSHGVRIETPQFSHENQDAPAPQTEHLPTQPMYTPLHEAHSQRPVTGLEWPFGQWIVGARPARSAPTVRLPRATPRTRANSPRTTKKGKPNVKMARLFVGEGLAGTGKPAF